MDANFDFDDDTGNDGPRWLEWPVAVWCGVIAGVLLAAILFWR